MITGDEPAFPMDYSREGFTMQHGLTIRQQFAMVAMNGLIANAPTNNIHNSSEGVQLAVIWADALIEELNKS